MGTVININDALQAREAAGKLCSAYGYCNAVSSQMIRNAGQRALHSNEPPVVAAHRCVPQKSRRLGDDPTPPAAA